MTRLLVAARPKDVSSAPFDAFVMRHTALVRRLAEHYDVSVLLLEPESMPDPGPLDLPDDCPVERISVPHAPDGRLDRLLTMRAAVREPSLASWERAAIEVVERFDPQAIVTLGPWLTTEYRALHGARPSVHFFEEDLSQMPELAPQSAQARALRSMTTAALGRRASQPRAIVAISPPELVRARRAAPRAEAVLVPLTLDPDAWPVEATMSTGDPVVVIGVLREARNAEGLAAVLGRVRDRGLGGRLRFRLVTGSGTHPVLDPFLGLGWVDAGPERTSLRAEYRNARCSLVPAFRATGMKTTILQAWANGCPVVTTPVCAAGVGEWPAHALTVGADADGLVDQLLTLEDDARRRNLAAAGRERLHDSFDRRSHDARVLALIERVVRSG